MPAPHGSAEGRPRVAAPHPAGMTPRRAESRSAPARTVAGVRACAHGECHGGWEGAPWPGVLTENPCRGPAPGPRVGPALCNLRSGSTTQCGRLTRQSVSQAPSALNPAHAGRVNCRTGELPRRGGRGAARPAHIRPRLLPLLPPKIGGAWPAEARHVRPARLHRADGFDGFECNIGTSRHHMWATVWHPSAWKPGACTRAAPAAGSARSPARASTAPFASCPAGPAVAVNHPWRLP
jgi:hypothetical protein